MSRLDDIDRGEHLRANMIERAHGRPGSSMELQATQIINCSYRAGAPPSVYGPARGVQ
jgi:hypothetical protein